jgi:hypothetical protein
LAAWREKIRERDFSRKGAKGAKEEAIGKVEQHNPIVNIPGVGQFNLCPKEDKFAIRPEISPALLCPACKKRPRKLMRECSACEMKKYRNKEAKR